MDPEPGEHHTGVAMPAWQGVFAEDEYAPLVEYVRLLGERGGAGGVLAKRRAS